MPPVAQSLRSDRIRFAAVAGRSPDEQSDIRGFALPKHKPACRYAHAGYDLLGISILQQTPPDAKARSTKPPNSCGMRSRMTLTPYLQLGEAATAGPPTSRHSMDRLAACARSPRPQLT